MDIHEMYDKIWSGMEPDLDLYSETVSKLLDMLTEEQVREFVFGLPEGWGQPDVVKLRQFGYAYLQGDMIPRDMDQPGTLFSRPGYLRLVETGVIEAESEHAAASRLFERHNLDDRPYGQEVRSMCVGDVIAFTNGVTLRCDSVGWKRL